MRSNFRSLRQIFAVAVLAAVTITFSSNPALAQGRKRGGQSTDQPAATETAVPAAKSAPAKTASATKPGTLTISADFSKTAEATRDYIVAVTAKGGKEPYTWTSSTGSIADGRFTTKFDSPGDQKVTVTATDSTPDKPLTATQDFIVKVEPRKMSSDDMITEARKGLATSEELGKLRTDATTAVSGVNDRVTSLVERVGKIEQKTSEPSVPSHVNFMIYINLALAVLLLAAVAIILYKGRKTLFAILLCVLFLGLAINSYAAAPAQKLICGDPTYGQNTFPSDNSINEAVCTGVKGSSVEIAGVTITDLKKTASGFTFKAQVPTTATPGYPEVKVDGNVVESSFEIVTSDEFDRRDAIITTVIQTLKKQGLASGGSGSSAGNYDQLAMALCTDQTGKPICGRELSNQPINGQQWSAKYKAADAEGKKLLLRSLFTSYRFDTSSTEVQAAITEWLKQAATEGSGVNKVLAGTAATAVKETKEYVDSKIGSYQSQISKIAQDATDARILANSALSETRSVRSELKKTNAAVVTALDGAELAMHASDHRGVPIIGGGPSKDTRQQIRQALPDVYCARVVVIYRPGDSPIPAGCAGYVEAHGLVIPVEKSAAEAPSSDQFGQPKPVKMTPRKK